MRRELVMVVKAKVPLEVALPVIKVLLSSVVEEKRPSVMVGSVPKTTAPVPVSPVTALAKFALLGVARKVATPVPKPETPVEMGRLIASVKSKAGVASLPPRETETPPYDTEELASMVFEIEAAGRVTVFETTRAEVEAVPETVSAVVDAYGNVEERVVEVAWKYGAAICLHASRPPAKVEVPVASMTRLCTAVEVALREAWAKMFVVISNAWPKEPPPVTSVPQERTPAVDDFTSQFAAFKPETLRLVVEAVPETVIAVEEA